MKKVSLLVMVLAAASVAAWACGCEGKDKPAGHDQAKGEHAMKMETGKEGEAAAYPLDYCLVTGEKLGSMGEAVTYVYEGQTFKFCCGGCLSTFKKDPSGWVAKLKEAVKKQVPVPSAP